MKASKCQAPKKEKKKKQDKYRRKMKGGALKAKFYVRRMLELRRKEQKAEMCLTCK